MKTWPFDLEQRERVRKGLENAGTDVHFYLLNLVFEGTGMTFLYSGFDEVTIVRHSDKEWIRENVSVMEAVEWARDYYIAAVKEVGIAILDLADTIIDD